MKDIQLKLNSLLKGDNRSRKAKLNVIYMLFIKGGSIIANLLLVPMTLNYVDSNTYGIWITLSSMVAWISFFDIGLNNGLKNKLTEALANNDLALGKKYVSTTYALLTLIFIPLMFLLSFVVPYVDWNSLLNLHSVNVNDLVLAIIIIVAYFCFSFILSTINVIMNAYQRPAQAALRAFIQQVVSLALIFLLVKTTEGSLLKLCLALCVSPLLVLSFFNIRLFRTDYNEVSPSFRAIDFSVLPDLLKLGFQFFIIQIAGIIQFQMVNFLIIRYYGAEDVTAYNIANKYFSILYMVWGILITPLWVAVTDAITKGEIQWIINAKKKLQRTLFFFIIIGVVMMLSSSFVYKIWVGSNVNIEWELSFSVFIYNVVLMFGGIYVTILNGLGSLRLQTLICLISPLVFFVVCYSFINMGLGVYSIILASIIGNFNGFIIAPIQLHMKLSKYQTSN